MTTVEQPRLPCRMDAYPLERNVITGQVNFIGAMDLSLSLCGFENGKDAARKLGIDSGAYSCKKNGEKPWAVDEMRRAMDIGRNLIPLAWLAHQYGHGLVMLETEAERRERFHQERIAELEMRNRVLIEALHGRSS